MLQKTHEYMHWSQEKNIDKIEIKHMVLDNLVIKDNHLFRSKCSKIKPNIKKIYYQWNIELLDKQICAIVGPRRMSQYAQDVLQKLFQILHWYDVVTISWAADGVDTMVHLLSCDYKIPTIAVLGGGIEYYYTISKRGLLEKIIASWGLILSEYENTISSRPYMFPTRNRIVAGFADCVFVPEAQHKSGSLITASYAKKMHIPIYAPMQNIFYASSWWTNQAIVEWIIQPLSQLQDFVQIHFQKRVDYISEQNLSSTWLQKCSQESIVSDSIITDENVVDYLIQDMQRRLFD